MNGYKSCILCKKYAILKYNVTVNVRSVAGFISRVIYNSDRITGHRRICYEIEYTIFDVYANTNVTVVDVSGNLAVRINESIRLCAFNKSKHNVFKVDSHFGISNIPTGSFLNNIACTNISKGIITYLNVSVLERKR